MIFAGSLFTEYPSHRWRCAGGAYGEWLGLRHCCGIGKKAFRLFAITSRLGPQYVPLESLGKANFQPPSGDLAIGGVAPAGAAAADGGTVHVHADGDAVISESERIRLEFSNRCETVLRDINQADADSIVTIIRVQLQSHQTLRENH